MENEENTYYLDKKGYNLLYEYKNLSDKDKEILEDFRFKPKGYIKIYKDDRERRVKLVNSFVTPILVFAITYLLLQAGQSELTIVIIGGVVAGVLALLYIRINPPYFDEVKLLDYMLLLFDKNLEADNFREYLKANKQVKKEEDKE